ncbi:hypothetical protein VNO77_44755 [Canavalia gladiata]|uniref:Uncharacterized protein n=1 Tax=Canavalia gladiata TaxID=3824 RepID=A0AAN9PR07_CANGL
MHACMGFLPQAIESIAPHDLSFSCQVSFQSSVESIGSSHGLIRFHHALEHGLGVSKSTRGVICFEGETHVRSQLIYMSVKFWRMYNQKWVQAQVQANYSLVIILSHDAEQITPSQDKEASSNGAKKPNILYNGNVLVVFWSHKAVRLIPHSFVHGREGHSEHTACMQSNQAGQTVSHENAASELSQGGAKQFDAIPCRDKQK